MPSIIPAMTLLLADSQVMGPPNILILEPNRFYSEALRRFVLLVVPNANCRVVQRVTEAQQAIQSTSFNLLISGVDAHDGDALDFISECLAPASVNRAVLVIAPRAEPRIGALLREAKIGGAFDAATDEPDNFATAIRKIMAGHTYSSPSFRWVVRELRSIQQRAGLLSPTERLVLAIIGDGCDDRTASERIGMKPSSVHAVRKSIHGKLKISQKGELVTAAAQCGYVRFSATGVTPVGFGLLLAEYQARSKRPLRLSAAQAARYPVAVEAAARRKSKPSS